MNYVIASRSLRKVPPPFILVFHAKGGLVMRVEVIDLGNELNSRLLSPGFHLHQGNILPSRGDGTAHDVAGAIPVLP